jgi:hypothetical protein
MKTYILDTPEYGQVVVTFTGKKSHVAELAKALKTSEKALSEIKLSKMRYRQVPDKREAYPDEWMRLPVWPVTIISETGERTPREHGMLRDGKAAYDLKPLTCHI